MHNAQENLAAISTVYDLSGTNVRVFTVYNLDMAKAVYIQVRGVDKAVQVQADKVEESGMIGTSAYALLISLKGTQVGKFNGNMVDGWWIQDD